MRSGSAVPGVVALVLLAEAIAGCGSPTPARSAQARSAVETFLALCAQQRAARVLDVLQPAARELVLGAPSPAEGCGRVLKAPEPARATPEAYRDAGVALASFDGNAARFDVTIGGARRAVTATYGFGLWRLEGPGS